ncbi:hypothetical protein FZCC0069_09000 [Rhodobacterales bacterium FZCC0069]|nr:hypothetical protein [Rhodobacterales bacterium FZCC0069]
MSAVYLSTLDLIDHQHLSLNRWSVIAEQEVWFQQKNACAEDYHCLNRVYKDRLISLTFEWRGQSFDTISDALQRSGHGQIEADRLERVILIGYAPGNHATSVPYYNNLFVFEPNGTFKLGHFTPKYWGWGRFPDGISPTPNLYRLNDTFAPVEDGYDALSIEQIGGTHYSVGNQYFRIETNCIKLISWDGGVRDNIGGEPDSEICLEDYDSRADGSVEGWITSLEPTR